MESGGTIVQETRLYNGETKVARSMRTKEDSDDYRYFPCPDLLPVILHDEYIDTVRLKMPEFPEAGRARFIADSALTKYDATKLTGKLAIAVNFYATVKP